MADSPFYQVPTTRKERREQLRAERLDLNSQNKWEPPTRLQLEEWYSTLHRLLNEDESFPPVHNTNWDDLESVRDEIYSFLR
jgi:hypothetical protein